MAIERDGQDGGDALVEFGFDGEGWLRLLREGRRSVFGRLGSYELVEEVGRGGQGVVYRGRQPGTGREVALKRLLAGTFATDAARKRFEREVEAASALRHAGVVTVYGLEMVDGEPILAMEWIEGIPITKWAVEYGGDAESVLRAFLQVCDAVAHAHRNGVIHRDLKPSNILVDREGRPRVLDFGLAKISHRGGGEEASLTQTDAFAGTIAYASPEQVGSGAAAVDTRSDVYSLGIVLYELLAGRPAVARDAKLEDLVEAILRTDPPPPSRLSARSPRELDHVVMAAIAKDRDRRYQSVDDFAADLRRFLSGEALHAHPPSRWYRAKKLVARHRLASVLIAALLALAAAFVVTTVHQTRVLKDERDAALLARKSEEEARLASEEQRENLHATLTFLFEDMIGAANPGTGSRDITVGAAVDRGRATVGRRFAGRPLPEAIVRRAIGDLYVRLARYADAEVELRRSLELLRNDLRPHAHNIGSTVLSLSRALVPQGKHDEARALLAGARELLREQGPKEYSELSVLLDEIAALEAERGDFARGAELSRESLELALRVHGADSIQASAGHQILSGYLLALGKLEEGRAELAQAIAIRERHGQADGEGADIILESLGRAELLVGNVDEGVRSLQKAAAISEKRYGDHPQTAGMLSTLAIALMKAQRLPEAEEAARRALSIHRAASLAPRRALAMALHSLARVRAAQGEHEDGAELMAEASDMFRALGNSGEAAGAAASVEAMRQAAESRAESRPNR
jgi:eukaryotic-like serine/threonine-protein kinase